MRIAAILMIISALLIGAPISAQESDQTDATKEVKVREELARRATFKQMAYEKMDKMVGKFVGSGKIDGLDLTLTINTQPKIINDLYYPGTYTLQDKDGKVVYEASTVLTFNTGGMSYFMFLFGGDEYIRSAFGTYEDNYIQLASPMPEGVEFYRFTPVDEDTLKLEKWDPVQNIGKPKGEPQTVVTLKKEK